jgi:hypothetical protein
MNVFVVKYFWGVGDLRSLSAITLARITRSRGYDLRGYGVGDAYRMFCGQIWILTWNLTENTNVCVLVYGWVSFSVLRLALWNGTTLLIKQWQNQRCFQTFVEGLSLTCTAVHCYLEYVLGERVRIVDISNILTHHATGLTIMCDDLGIYLYLNFGFWCSHCDYSHDRSLLGRSLKQIAALSLSPPSDDSLLSWPYGPRDKYHRTACHYNLRELKHSRPQQWEGQIKCNERLCSSVLAALDCTLELIAPP